MPGRGPAPKPPEQRRRRNAPERGEWVTLEAVTTPMLPQLDPDVEWHPRTRSLWSAWRQDPASTMFGPAEIAAAVELAWMMDEFARADSTQGGRERISPGELRLRMDGLGLSAKGKRDLRWRTPAEAEAESTEGKLAPVRKLRAVDSAA